MDKMEQTEFKDKKKLENNKKKVEKEIKKEDDHSNILFYVIT
jgi:hypothetical protein